MTTTNYVGTGARLAPGDIGRAAKAVGLETAALLAWIEVEVGASIRGFDNAKRVVILPEPHQFYARLGAGTKRNLAVAKGVAYPKWGTRPYPPSSDARYQELAVMESIDVEAARDSTSMGLGQILGANAEACGLANGTAMLTTFMTGEKAQLDAMVKLLQTWGITKSLFGKDLTKPASWQPAAKRYNGSGYAKNKYDQKLAAAYLKHSAAGDPLVALANTSTPSIAVVSRTLRLGMKGEEVMNLQSDLVERGYDPGPVDGRYGDKTSNAVKSFQTANKITPSGTADLLTLDRLSKGTPDVIGRLMTPVNPTGIPRPDSDTSSNWIGTVINLVIDFIVGLFNK